MTKEVIEFSDEEDGSLSIEFCMGKGKMLAISVRPNGYISWVLCWDEHKEYGTHKLQKREPMTDLNLQKQMTISKCKHGIYLDGCRECFPINADKAIQVDKEWKILQKSLEKSKQEQDEPVAYINVEQRKLEWAKPIVWGTPTVANLPKIPLYTYPKGCDECGVGGGYALYCVGCAEKFFGNKEWVGLTDYEIKGVLGLSESWVGEDCSIPDMIGFARALEAKLKEKNT